MVHSISIETVYLEIGPVRMSFIGYDYPMLEKTILWSEIGIRLASLDDVACMKLSAVVSRGTRKDFIDLHFLITQYRPLGEYLNLYRKKYQNRDIGHVIRSLVYFADAEKEHDIKTRTPLLWETVKTDFETWVTGLSIP